MVCGGYSNHMHHLCAKGFLDLNFNQAVNDKISIFQEIAPNFTFKKCKFNSIIGLF